MIVNPINLRLSKIVIGTDVSIDDKKVALPFKNQRIKEGDDGLKIEELKPSQEEEIGEIWKEQQEQE